MSRKLTLREVEQKYNLLFNKAKEDYKSSRNLKNSRGFKESPEYLELLRKKEDELRRIGADVSGDILLESEKNNRKLTPDERIEIQGKSGISNINWIADHEIFYIVLSYGSDQIKSIQTTYNQLINKGKNVAVTVFYMDGTERVTMSPDLPSISGIVRDFKLKIEKLKKAYKKKRGLKIARGFKSSKSFLKAYREFEVRLSDAQNKIKSTRQAQEAEFLQNIEKLYLELVEEESNTDLYPLVDIISFSINNELSAISVRPVKKEDWLPKIKKSKRK